MLYVVTNRLLLPVLEGHAVDPDMLVLDLLVVPLAAVMTLALLVRHEESRSRANEALRQSEEQFTNLVAVSPDAIIVHQDGAVSFANAAAARLVGAGTADQVIGQPLLDFVHPDDRELVKGRVRMMLQEGVAAARTDERFLRADGSVVDVRVAAAPLLLGARPAVLVLAHDITERKQTAAALAASEQRFREMLANIELLAVMLDREGRITFVNDFLLERTGWQRAEIDGRDWFATFVAAEGRAEARRGFAETVTGDLALAPRREHEIVTRTGERRLVAWTSTLLHDASGAIVGTARLGEDVTDRRILEQQLFQAQKMESIGRLAGGIAHDMNNLLNVIGGYTELVLDDLGDTDPHRTDLEEVVRAQGRASELTGQLLAFGRRQVLLPRVLDINAIVGDVVPMLRRVLGADVQVATRLDPDLGRVRADPGQLEQVLLNLAVNARDAMSGGGTLTIATDNVVLDGQGVQGAAGAPPGRGVSLTVSDTGTGMDDEVKRHLFEPFFTTKAAGVGTGLGLATVYGIIKQSGGSIWIDSELGTGTSVRIHLPRVDEALEPNPAQPAILPLVGGSETILVVEDYAVGRAYVCTVLQSLGYRVLAAADGDEALSQAAGCEGPIDLLLTDVVMPRMSGLVVAAQVTSLRPSTRVLYISGYAESATTGGDVFDPSVQFLAKPFTPEALARKVRAVLDR